jgi:hypothetical protein
VCRDVSHPVGTQNQDQGRHLGVVGEQVDETFPFGQVVAQGERRIPLWHAPRADRPAATNAS